MSRGGSGVDDENLRRPWLQKMAGKRRLTVRRRWTSLVLRRRSDGGRGPRDFKCRSSAADQSPVEELTM